MSLPKLWSHQAYHPSQTLMASMKARLLFLLAAVLLAGAATPAPKAAYTTAAGLAQTRALLAALQKSSPTVAAVGGSAATARALIAQLDALKPAGPTAAAASSAPVNMPPALVTSIARVLANAGIGSRLTTLMAAGGPLASMAAPYSRATRCKAIRQTTVSQAVKDCYCSASKAQPWPRCDALLHLELQAAAVQLDGLAKQMKAYKPTVNKQSQPARRLMQRKCGDAKALDLIMAATATGCTALSCSWALDSIPLSIKLNLNGCAPTMGLSDTDGNGQVGAGDTVKYCQKGACTSLPFATAAKWETAAPYFNAGLAGTVDVCLGFPALTAQLAKFGWANNGTWCPQTGVTATWYPLKRQVGVGGRVSAVILSQGVWADLSGSINIAAGKTNPACTAFGPLDSAWRCAPFCAWGAGQGKLTANLGWKVLWMTNTVTKSLLNTPVAC